MTKLKIIIVSTPVFQLPLSGYGGLEAIAWETAKGLAAKGHEVALVCPEGSTCPGVTIIPNGKAGSWDERAAYGSYWQELLKYNVVICHDWQKWAYWLKIEGRLKAPVLGVMHAPVNTMYQSLPELEKPCFVCISEDQGNHFRALYGRDCRVAYNGICLETYAPMNLPRSERYLFLARFSTIKGPDLAIEACKQAGKQLDLIGDTSITNEPEYLKQIQMECEKSFGKFKLVGPAKRGECVWWFNQAKALLHSAARFREPFGLSVVESMACGTPVISFDFGACRETIVHGETGFLVKSLDEMVELLKTDAVNTIKPERCRENAGRFSTENMTARYEILCQEALGGGW